MPEYENGFRPTIVPGREHPPHHWDFHPAESRFQQFNKWLAIKVTTGVGTMVCAYIFALIALAGLPTAISESVTAGFHPLPLVQWVAQTFLQLVLLSVIIVGQNIQARASDARAELEFEDTKALLELQKTAANLLRENTELTQAIHDLVKDGQKP